MKALVSAGVMMLVFACAMATDYTVGDDRGWTGPPNITSGYYQSWAANKTFMSGDTLNFMFNGTHDVAMVTKQDYDNCSKVQAQTAPSGSSLPFTFITGRNLTYYFICTVGSHCEGGQKLAVDVIGPAYRASPSSVMVATALAIIPLAAVSIFG
ncbi:hypothetical protein MLD38_014600 [Melastoma candidum]|uniref:Uncharacterized protein n=1 Tax=Melastoma candidum TaxID=119954 RepID=A0ACB9REM8_9MYRT|nr:hypothetical protein MLD38_014600 [Melastoma candidum]